MFTAARHLEASPAHAVKPNAPERNSFPILPHEMSFAHILGNSVPSRNNNLSHDSALNSSDVYASKLRQRFKCMLPGLGVWCTPNPLAH